MWGYMKVYSVVDTKEADSLVQCQSGSSSDINIGGLY